MKRHARQDAADEIRRVLAAIENSHALLLPPLAATPNLQLDDRQLELRRHRLRSLHKVLSRLEGKLP